jgi:hypothetical protein
MKAQMFSKAKVDYLFHHLLDGFKSTQEGLEFVRGEKIVTDAEYHELVEKNAKRLIERIHEFKLANKMISVFFAGLFTWMQVGGEDLDMRRARRTRSGRRRNETEQIDTSG